MAQIHGQIDSLKQIRRTLDEKSIGRFNSVNELHDFLKNYKSEEKVIQQQYEDELATDIKHLKQNINYNQWILKGQRNKRLEKLNRKMIASFNGMTNYKTKYNQSNPEKIFAPVIAKIYETRLKYLQKNYDDILEKSSKKVVNRIHNDQNILKRLVVNKHREILTRSETEMKQLAQIKEVVMSLNPLIAGAIGENLVVNEIKKLSDDYILINNFTLQLDTPIYYKKDKSKIRSIQIDHLLISKAGIFILETKNWSRKTMESKHVRSPVEQVKRSGYALFVLLSRRNINLKKHVWGENKEIPIRNIVVMINSKPKERFHYVKIKTLKELNAYIEHFEPIFSDEELKKIHIGLISLT